MVKDPDAYWTIDTGSETELRIKGSRFLGRAFHAPTLEAAADALSEIRRAHRDATHHCWAYRVNPSSPATRFDDDGEPSGSAGKPILQVLEGAAIDDAVLVVTRYFGGTKLGTGGLVRAYSQAAAAALEDAPRKQCWFSQVLRAAYDFNDLGGIEGVLARKAPFILSVDREFDPVPSLMLTIKASKVKPVMEELVETTAGRVRCTLETGL